MRPLEETDYPAREAKHGLGDHLHSVPPWIYRKARGGSSLNISDFGPSEEQEETLKGIRSARLF